MRVGARHVAWTLLAAGCAALPRAQAGGLDRNGDGLVRVALVSTATHPGELSAEALRADLEGMLKAGDAGVPARVSLEPLGERRTLLGWWYHPDAAASRAQLLAGQYDVVLLAESETIVRGYPELFFEGVRAIQEGFAATRARLVLVLLARPATSFRDTRAAGLADTVYRVGDGCGLEVSAAAFAWQEALARNRVAGDSPVRARASAYASAAAVYCDLTGDRVPRAAWQADWTTARTTEALALSARDAVRRARVSPHYRGPFRGVVRIEPRIKKRLKIYVPGTAADDPVRANFQYILDAAFQDGFWKSPADWYQEGFDRYASPFDLVYADTRQMDQFLAPDRYTAYRDPPTNRVPPCTAVFSRNPGGDPGGADVLRNLETVLLEGYDYAKARDLVFVPYQVAWARVWREHPDWVAEPAPGRANDWLSYMLANMLYTLVTDRFQPVPERAKPAWANADHPHGHHERCARIGYDTMRQLSRLSSAVNAVVLRTETYRVDASSPGFASVRLLDRPTAEARVFCATDVPGVAALSRESFVFTPQNYDIEQSLRILPATNQPTLFFHFMVGAQSEDRAVDGANDVRPFLLNFDERAEGGFAFGRDRVSPSLGFEVPVAPDRRPIDAVCARVIQHGQVTEELYFTHDAFGPRPVRLYPTAESYRSGLLRVEVAAESSDLRFNGRRHSFVFRVSGEGAAVPQVAVTAPGRDEVVEGPAFVNARAEAAPTGGVEQVALFLGPKRLGAAAGAACAAPVERGPPQSRLGEGRYTVWAAARGTNGLVVASEPLTFQVREPPAGADPAP